MRCSLRGRQVLVVEQGSIAGKRVLDAICPFCTADIVLVLRNHGGGGLYVQGRNEQVAIVQVSPHDRAGA